MTVYEWCRKHIPTGTMAETEIARLVALLREVAQSGVEYDGARNYVVVQIDCDVWERVQREGTR